MGFGGISIWQLAIVLVIVILIFGTKKLKSLGSDLGGAVKGFKEATSKDNDGEPEQLNSDTNDNQTNTSVKKETEKQTIEK